MLKLILSFIIILPISSFAKNSGGSGNPVDERSDVARATRAYNAALAREDATRKVAAARLESERYSQMVQRARDLVRATYALDASQFDVVQDRFGDLLLTGSRGESCKYSPAHESCSRCGGGNERVWTVPENLHCPDYQPIRN